MIRCNFLIVILFCCFLLACSGGGGSSNPRGGEIITPPTETNPVSPPVAAPMPDPVTPPVATPRPPPAPDPVSPPIRSDPTFRPRSLPVSGVLNTPDSPGFAARKVGFESEDEYSVSYHLDMIGAAAAYARGATGSGQKLLIVDGGIRESHQEFSGANKLTHVPFNPGSSYRPAPDTPETRHGSLVAGIAAGRRDQKGMHGVAFDARIYLAPLPGLALSGENFITTSSPQGPTTNSHDPINIPTYSFENAVHQIPSLMRQTEGILALARSVGSSVANLSFGFSGYAASRFHVEDIKREFRPLANLLAQSETPPENKVILVYSAGNEGALAYTATGQELVFDSPSVFKSLALPFPELRSHILVVVAVNEDGGIRRASNRCGLAKDFCLAAPGGRIYTADYQTDDGYTRVSGTSYSAPMVSGALLLLKEYFRDQLGNHELVDRLLSTANREGIYADSYVYGHGLLDLDAATRPVGVVMMALPSAYTPLAGSTLEVPSAYGAALLSAFNGIELVGFDDFNHPFWFGLPGFLSTHRLVPELSGWLSDQPVAEQGVLLAGLNWLGGQGSDLRLASSKDTFAFSSGFGLSPRQSLYGFRSGLLVEQNSHQQTRGYGAFGSDVQSGMVFLSYEKRWKKGQWSLGSHLLLAVGDADYQDTGMFQTSDSIYSSTKLSLNYQDQQQRVQFKIEQPLRAETGKGTISYAYQRSTSGGYLYRQESFSLVPDARTVQLSAHYEKRLYFGELAVEFNHRLNADHSSGKQDTWLSAGYRWQW